MLDGGDAPCREALAVTQTVDKVDDRRFQITGKDEVAVHGVHDALFLECALRSDERLRHDLTAENAAAADVTVVPAIDVELDRLEVEQLEQIADVVTQITAEP